MGPLNCINKFEAALHRIKQEDVILYDVLTTGIKCKICTSLSSAESSNNLNFEFDIFFISLYFSNSQNLLISFFVFLYYFDVDYPFFEMENAQQVKNFKSKTTIKTVKWLETKNYPDELIELVKNGVFEK